MSTKSEIEAIVVEQAEYFSAQKVSNLNQKVHEDLGLDGFDFIDFFDKIDSLFEVNSREITEHFDDKLGKNVPVDKSIDQIVDFIMNKKSGI